jgi:hypothetical protein
MLHHASLMARSAVRLEFLGPAVRYLRPSDLRPIDRASRSGMLVVGAVRFTFEDGLLIERGHSLMARVKIALSPFHRIAKQQEAIKSLERRLADRERTLVADIGRLLSGFGYQLTRLDEATVTAPARGKRTRVRQDLKCPKCERRFFFPMHVARHMNTVHRRKAKRRDQQKVKAA